MISKLIHVDYEISTNFLIFCSSIIVLKVKILCISFLVYWSFVYIKLTKTFPTLLLFIQYSTMLLFIYLVYLISQYIKNYIYIYIPVPIYISVPVSSGTFHISSPVTKLTRKKKKGKETKNQSVNKYEKKNFTLNIKAK